MTDVNAAIDTITTHALSAGTALAAPVYDVIRGDPIPGPGRSVRVWYGGETEPERYESGTLAAELVGERVLITAYWPIPGSDAAQARARDVELRTYTANLRTNIVGDSSLGGTVTDLVLGHARPDFAVYNGTWYRVFEWEAVLDFSEYTRTA